MTWQVLQISAPFNRPRSVLYIRFQVNKFQLPRERFDHVGGQPFVYTLAWGITYVLSGCGWTAWYRKYVNGQTILHSRDLCLGNNWVHKASVDSKRYCMSFVFDYQRRMTAKNLNYIYIPVILIDNHSLFLTSDGQSKTLIWKPWCYSFN